MEPRGYNAGNRWQIESAQKRRKQAKTVALDCDQLPIEAHGKEGSTGSSPSDGSAKSPINTFLVRIELHVLELGRYGALHGASKPKARFVTRLDGSHSR
jgi:hypothetical protein